VEFFDDEDASPPEMEQLKLVARLGRRIARMLQLSWPDLDRSTRPSFVIADHMPLDLSFKQELLVKRREHERLAALADHLEELSQRLEVRQRTQRLAGANGQAGGH
jgi:hypothetical protein